MNTIRFGTDGWRGRIADNYTFDNVRRCAQGFAFYLRDKGLAERGVVVGYDKRFASEYFAAAAAEVLAANGIHVWLTQGATPTPVISYSAVAQKAGGAVNITASHNPPMDNGFKVRDPHGGAIDPAGLKEIEARIPDVAGVRRMGLEEAERKGLVERFDPAPAYLEHLGDLIDLEPLKDAGFTIVVDPMWGNGAGWFPRLLEGGATRVLEIHNIRNPIFPEMHRPEPIPPNVNGLLSRVKEVGADVGIATDGDADRLGAADEHGVFIDQLQMYSLLTLYALEVRGWRGPIVKTVSTSSMLNKLGEMYGVPVYEVGVGFKYVAPKMLETDAMIGGEESGGYAFRGHIPERDGILAGLFLLDMMVQMDKTPSQLVEHLYNLVGPHHYGRVDSDFPQDRREAIRERVAKAQPSQIAGSPVVRIDTTDGHKFYMADGSWLLIRFSGTEPIIRVYTETTSKERVPIVLQEGLKIAGLA